jgi:hypothetical protein
MVSVDRRRAKPATQLITITTYIRITITIITTTKHWIMDHHLSICSDSLRTQYRTQVSPLIRLIITIITIPHTRIQDTIITIPQHAHLPYLRKRLPVS